MNNISINLLQIQIKVLRKLNFLEMLCKIQIRHLLYSFLKKKPYLKNKHKQTKLKTIIKKYNSDKLLIKVLENNLRGYL